MTAQLFIENYEVDVNSSLASLITFAIDDIKDFASRQTAFSKTIYLPGSARNNKILGNIFEIGSANDYDPALPNVGINFNASASANCIYFQDNIQAFKGSLRILQINIYRGKIEYEVAIAGVLSLLNVQLSSGLLEDLDFSAYDHTYNETNVIASWDNPGGSGYFYPLIDHGDYSTNKHDWDILTFRPALYAKEYIDKMFTVAGFRYSSAFFDSSFFEQIIIPHNQKRMATLSNNAFNANATVQNYTSSGGSGDPFGFNVSFDDVTIAGDFTPSGGFDPYDEFTYSGTNTIIGTISTRITGIWNNANSATLALQKNGVTVASVIINSGGSSNNFSQTISANISLTTGDTISVYLSSTYGGGAYTLTVNSGYLNVTSSNSIVVPINYGEAVTMNSQLPKNIRQVDFLVSLCKMFNLYVNEDKFDERLLYITPYVDFYSEESQNAVDWTYKLDRSQNIMLTPMSEVNAKVYHFKYKEDSDYYNDLYKKRYNQTYGSYLYDTDFDFVSQTQNVDIIFAGTPLVGYAGEDKVYSTIFKLNDNVEEQTDSVIRILQAKKITGVTSWDILDGVSVLDSLTDYGYAGHLDDPDAPTSDLNFGVSAELFFILVAGDLSANLFNVFWSSYMAEITDKDSKLLTGRFYLTPKDIADLDFSKYVNVDGNLFRINKIEDYNMTKPDLCNVQLLKVINTLY